MTIEELTKEVIEAANVAKSTINAGDVDGLMLQLGEAAEWMARSAVLVAEAVAIRATARAEATKKYYAEKIPPSYMREMMDGECVDAEKIFTWTERLNAALTHRVDALRTLISAEKSIAEGDRYRGGR